jgi:hypothetical protein
MNYKTRYDDDVFLVCCLLLLKISSLQNGRIQHFQRQNQRLQNQINAYTIKVRAENQQRRQKGQAEIAEDLSQFKKLVPPSRLPSLVWMHQVDVYVDQVEDFARESALKLFLLTELENKK